MNISLFKELIEFINDYNYNDEVLSYVSKANKQELENLLEEVE